MFIRVVGRGTFQNSQPLQQYAQAIIDRGDRQFTIDLGKCQGLDSTFLGVLAGIGLRLRELGATSSAHVINASSQHRELLQTLGLDRLFVINASRERVPENGELNPLPGADVAGAAHPLTKDEAAGLILAAHENLIRTDKRNAPRFKELLKSLRATIRRRRTRPKT